MHPPLPPPPNHFLQSLSRGDFELLRPHLKDVKLAHAAVLFDAGGLIERVYFPHSGVISLVVVLSSGDMIETGMIGRDGVAGTSAALDGAVSLNRAVVQRAGVGSTIETQQMRAAVATSKSLRVKLYEHDQMLLAQAQQSAACNAKHQIEERLCRWLLRTRDLVESDNIELTQEFLAQMLGVRRTSVTLAAQHLQGAGLIKYRRGHIQILDVEALQDASCECYEAVKSQVARLQAQPR
ncbi:MAG TPA: Crp/Fnr family transcriptional regulator [Xanthobacteraceae bacterium]|nr:Crp/Fnr family transcriptional regulator [Xanthobacteraceae bacterium]